MQLDLISGVQGSKVTDLFGRLQTLSNLQVLL
jgi:hypothetical protein